LCAYRLQRDLAEGELLVGAGDLELAVLELDVASSASIRKAAIFLALASTLSSALTIADMPTAPEREP
jgi:hypothetical protein